MILLVLRESCVSWERPDSRFSKRFSVLGSLGLEELRELKKGSKRDSLVGDFLDWELRTAGFKNGQ